MKKQFILFLVLTVGFYTMYGQSPGDPGYCDDVQPGYVYYLRDYDGDGWSDGNGICADPNNPPSGHFRYDFRRLGDCNDFNNSVYPRRWYVDNDGDGYGSTIYHRPCTGPQAPSGYADNNDDCDDGDASITVVKDWYQDFDGDTYGDVTTKVTDCGPPTNFVNPVNRAGDYDDTDEFITNIPPMNFYYDGDGDTYGLASNFVFRSEAPEDYVDRSGDCNDNDATLNPETIWYFDADDDGLGASGATDKIQCEEPTEEGYVRNSQDLCPNEYAQTANGCIDTSPKEVTNRDKNWVWSLNLDADGNIKSNAIGYFDEFGKPTQNQSLDIKTGRTWASQTLYDQKGRPAIQTLGAPIGFSSTFEYKENFIQNSGGTVYSLSDFDTDKENPATVGPQAESLGWYYSNNNNREPYQDITAYPFSRTIHSELMPGTVLRTVGANKIDSNNDGSITTNDRWAQGYAFSMQAPATELAVGSAFGPSFDMETELIKTVTRDPHGEENVSYTDTDGQVLATARGGGGTANSATLPIGPQGYVDVHIAQGLSGITITNSGAVTIYDLITEEPVTASLGSLPNGFYRIAINDLTSYTPNSISVGYDINYYDYSLNVYDRAERLITSYQAVGADTNSKPQSSYSYKASGQLIETQSVDEGTARFIYRDDGQIRFSQNSKQALVNEVSYTDYDTFGRPEESGVATGLVFDNLIPTSSSGNNKKEQHFTYYDDFPDFVNPTTDLPLGYREPAFLNGNVAMTKNDHSTTYYSYDVYGRVQWLVQDIEFIGAKTTDYSYDAFTGSVTHVTYQKENADERFIHKYNYNNADQLTLVETSLDGTSWETHAEYEYYETGEMKRTELAGVQGVDYVYNIAGQLKAINLPGQGETNDPEDLFRMQLDYHTNDYNRPVPNIAPQAYGENRFNGNIKGSRWKNTGVADQEAIYAYAYDRNNWLTSADYGADGIAETGTTIPLILENETVTASQQKIYENPISITIRPESHFQFESDVLVRIGGSTGAGGAYDVSNIKYDANGNIQSLIRNKGEDNDGIEMDNLSYTYDPEKPNQLKRVDDANGAVTGANDLGEQLGDQNGTNYHYNAIGQLIEDWEQVTQEEKDLFDQDGTEPGSIIKYEYNASGLVTQVTQNNLPLVKFFYNDRNHRVRKESHGGDGSLQSRTHYVRDVSGQVLSIAFDDLSGGSLEQEYPVYGASRLGIYKRTGNTGVTYYELTDHLGNVRAVFSKSGSQPAIQGYTDYFPFGSPMPNRIAEGNYRYAFQGQEKDSETRKEAFELRLWDGRIGRWLTTDPYGEFNSPYLGMGNNPISLTDPDGGSTGQGKMLEHRLEQSGLNDLVFRADYFNFDFIAMEFGSLENVDGFGTKMDYTYGDPIFKNGGYNPLNSGHRMTALLQGTYGLMSGGIEYITTPLRRVDTEKYGNNYWDQPSMPLPVGGGASKLPGVASNGIKYGKWNYRKNLKIFTGFNGKGFDAHHVFSKKFADFFASKSININHPEYLRWWQISAHRTHSYEYNRRWQGYILGDGRDASRQDVIDFGFDLMKEYGF